MPSALELEFSVYYREFDRSVGPWTGTRIRKLCNLLKLTLPEFCAMIRVPEHLIESYCLKGRFPGCVKTVLNLVERSAHRKYLGTAYEQSVLPYEL